MEKFSDKRKENQESQESVLKKTYVLLGAHTPLELFQLYTQEDQKLMKSGTWDYKNPDLTINQVKDILESIDASQLTQKEVQWRQEILWFWYHHAISCAIGRYKDKEKAKFYAAKALKYQSEGHPNKITRLLAFLVNDKVEEAEEWVKTIDESEGNGNPEKETALSLLKKYKEQGFFH